MNENSIRSMLKAVPFAPFEVRMSSGEVHAIKHPENVIVAKGRMVHVDPKTGDVAILSLFHVTGIEHAAVKSKSK